MSRNASSRIPGIAPLACVLAILVLTPGVWAASKYKTLHRFKGGKDWIRPTQNLIFDPEGNLYSTTSGGGNASDSGTVFELRRNTDGLWTESALYSFCSLPNCSDGSDPAGDMVFDAQGNVYGTTASGGAYGGGTVFELMPKPGGGWNESVLYDFCSLTNCIDGSEPDAGPVFDAAGNLYGTTQRGGASDGGTAFELTPNADGSWSESVLHTFVGKDGYIPRGRLAFDRKVNLYGTTYLGGKFGAGTAFELTPHSDGSWTESVLHSFGGKSNDGSYPGSGGLIFDASGNLYGMTAAGGTGNCIGGVSCGVVFKLTPKAHGHWNEKVIHDFADKDGAQPSGGLTSDRAGNLYSMTEFGGKIGVCDGPEGCGLVFKLTQNSNGRWHETVLHYFFDRPGADPLAGVTFDEAGNLYGTTGGDGVTTFGSVFEITP